MPSDPIEAQIDSLYQLPLERFTAARDALAKESGAGNAARIRALRKPTLPAWAVNQLHWRKKPAFDRIIRTAGELRRAQEKVLAGGGADLRERTAAHRSAIKEGLEALEGILVHAGHLMTPATRQAVRQTLEALPGRAKPGRLSAALEAPGFEVFAGMDPRKLRSPAARKPRSRPAAPEPRKVERPRGPSTPPGEKLAAARASRAEARERKVKARLAKEAAADARRRLGSARLAARKAEAASRKASAVLEEERARERRARESHESAARKLAGAEADAERLRREAESAAAALSRAEEELGTAPDER